MVMVIAIHLFMLIIAIISGVLSTARCLYFDVPVCNPQLIPGVHPTELLLRRSHA
jgi:hypothetical protein